MATGEQHGVSRRLAAILAADVAGYSRLMGNDEVGTLRALKAHRRELVDPTIARHHGRIVKTTGDGMLVEFRSIVDAVACAVAVQRGMVGRNATVPRRSSHRVSHRHQPRRHSDRRRRHLRRRRKRGCPARGACEPGGVCISRAANEQIRDKLSLAFADLGERTVKNIARSIGVFGLAAHDIAQLPEEMLPQQTAEGTAVPPATVAPQQIRFCRTVDGVQLAYARIGQGPPLVKAGAS